MIRRVLVAVFVAMLIWPSNVTPVHAALSHRAITWTVDHDHKTITVKAKLQIYLQDCWSHRWTPGGGAVTKTGRDCTKTAADIAKAIRDNIENTWNRGYHYGCYLLIFIVEVTVTTNRFTVDPDKMGVSVDRMTIDMRSHVMTTFGSLPTSIQDRWNSNDPADRIEPDNAAFLPTEWGYPPMSRYTYAHEFGHLLGLHDTYVEGTWEPKPGAPVDVMSDSSTYAIDQSTIDRVVERNRDRLKDTSGRSVDLDDLTCDLLFRAFLEGHEVDYHAIHLMDSLATRPCTGAPVKAAQDQRLDVVSEPVDVVLVEDVAMPAGYRFDAVFDQLTLQLRALGRLPRSPIQAGMFDLPVTVTVLRTNGPPTGDVPDVKDLQGGGCADGVGAPDRPDCGIREYKTWLAIQIGPGPTIWPGPSLLPRTLSGIGYSDLRLGSLYRSCSGPIPWPGAFKGEQYSNTTFGSLPALISVQHVSDDWVHHGRPGMIEIEGNVKRYNKVVGSLVDDKYPWTLTLCPVDKDGKIPAGCPL